MALAVRAAGDPAALSAGLRRAVRAADPGLPVYGVQTLTEIRASELALTRLNSLLLTALGLIGLLLAAVGIYGVIAWFVSQRTQEIGLRMALGATETRVLAMVAWQALRPVIAGMVLGLLGAFAVTRAISGLALRRHRDRSRHLRGGGGSAGRGSPPGELAAGEEGGPGGADAGADALRRRRRSKDIKDSKDGKDEEKSLASFVPDVLVVL